MIGCRHSSRSSLLLMLQQQRHRIPAQLYNSKVTIMAIQSHNNNNNNSHGLAVNLFKKDIANIGPPSPKTPIPVSRSKELLKLIRFDKPIGSL